MLITLVFKEDNKFNNFNRECIVKETARGFSQLSPLNIFYSQYEIDATDNQASFNFQFGLLLKLSMALLSIILLLAYFCCKKVLFKNTTKKHRGKGSSIKIVSIVKFNVFSCLERDKDSTIPAKSLQIKVRRKKDVITGVYTSMDNGKSWKAYTPNYTLKG